MAIKIGLRRNVLNYIALLEGRFTSADLSIFHEFEPPPAGGGHQFLRAFMRQAEAKGLRTENNRISHTARACLFNSFNFDERRLQLLKRRSILYVHRVDGPIDVYRGRDDGVDRSIHVVNSNYADRTIFQSSYSMQKHLELGMEFRNPTVIMNAADPAIFHSRNRVAFSRNRKVQLVAASWSSNLNKGTPIYQWLDTHLDWDRYEMTFIGQSRIRFKNIHMIPAVNSYKLAELLREHDIYITASKHDPCSNSLIEALACGLPAIYLQSGGHPEIVNQAGAGFDVVEQIPQLLEKIVASYENYQSLISLPSIEEVSQRYLEVLELV